MVVSLTCDSKELSRWWGLVGLFGIAGWIVIVLLPAKKPTVRVDKS